MMKAYIIVYMWVIIGLFGIQMAEAQTIKINNQQYTITRGNVYNNGQRVGTVRTSSQGMRVTIDGKTYNVK